MTNSSARYDFSQRDLPGPALALAGPVFGLAYISILPLIEVINLVCLGLCRAREGLAATRR